MAKSKKKSTPKSKTQARPKKRGTETAESLEFDVVHKFVEW